MGKTDSEETVRDGATDGAAEATTLLAIAGHELRTPIGAILTLVELLQSTDLDEQQRYFLASIQEAAQMGLSLAEDILQAGRAAKGKAPVVMAPYEPRRVVDEVISMLTPAAEHKGVSLGADSEALRGRWVAGNRDAVRRIVASLVENALKYTDKGQVEVRAVIEEPAADATATPLLVLRVADTGSGLYPADRQRLFEAFERGAGVVGNAGTGLGLWIVQALVQSLGGTIAVDSERGKGTTFTVRLPAPAAAAVEEESDGQSAEDAVPVVASGAPVRVLVVDDNRFSREIALACLSGFGMESVAVGSGERALDVLARADWAYDVVLLDLTMPGLDGYETAREIHARAGRAIPIIAMSAWTGDAAPEKIARFADRIDKPFKPNDLYKAIRGVLKTSAKRETVMTGS